MLRRIVPYLGYFYMSLVGRTTRLRVHGAEHRLALRRANQRFIYALWHNRQVFFTFTHRRMGAAVLVSQSKDGDIVAKVMELSGIDAPRGSSSRGGSAAVRDMMAMTARGLDIGITPDGPKGPVYEVKSGVMFLAQKLGIPILPVTNAISRKMVFRRSWDLYQVPLPFSRSVVRYAPPIFIGPEDDLAAKSRELKKSLDEITRQADEEIGDGLPLAARAALWALDLTAPLAALAVVVKFALSPRRGALRRLPGELAERAGRLSQDQLARLSGRRVLWVHAASAGEVAAVAGLLERLKNAPNAPAVVLSCSSGTGRDAARSLACVDLAVMAPIDGSFALARFLDAVKPYALLIVETELWPNMIAQCARRGVRIGLVNGRISQKAFARYRWIAPAIAPILGRIERLAAQTPRDAQRFKSLGVSEGAVLVVGNMKHDRTQNLPSPEAAALVKTLGWQGSPLLVAGSTHPLEEEALIAAYLAVKSRVPDLRLVLAPRHVERSDDAAQALRGRGVRFARWSQGVGEEPADALLLDTLGKLPGFYALAAVSFVGGTLVPVGGHNLLEPAFSGSPVLFGPYTEHAQDGADLLTQAGGGFQVSGAPELERRLEFLLADPARAAAAGQKARAAAEEARGAVERTYRLFEELLRGPGEA